MSVDNTATTTTTNTNTATTPWARAQELGLLVREGEWDTVAEDPAYFFDSHGQLWETVSRAAKGAEPFGPRGAACRITEDLVRDLRAYFDEWTANASEYNKKSRRQGWRREVELLEDLMGLSPIETK